MQHVTTEGTALVKQAEDAASNKKVRILVSLFAGAYIRSLCIVSLERVIF